MGRAVSEEVTRIESEYVASTTTRRRIVVSSLLFTWALIGLLVWNGDPSNSLHTSALAWGFVANMAVLFAYSFGIVIQKYFSK